MTYLQPYYSDHYNWYCASKDEKVTHSGLWGPEKTIFDPCPVGYKVPGSNLWGIPSGNTSLRNGGPVEDYDENGVSDKWDWNKAEDCGRRWKTPATTTRWSATSITFRSTRRRTTTRAARHFTGLASPPP